MISSGFTRRVSFDNYQPPQHTPPPTDSPSDPTYFFPTTKAISSSPKIAHNSEHPHQPTSILKSCTSINNDNFLDNKKPSQPLLSSNATANNTTHNTNSINDDTTNNNYSLQSPTSFNNIRKKSYSEMSDNELLALDGQFNIRSIDFQKDYGFNVTPRLSSNSFSNSDKDTISNNSRINTNFKNLSPNAILKEYPTKPIITKNSICVNFRHSNLKSMNNTDSKFYLLLLSNHSSSLSSLNYYINNILTKGDTLVICCSLSTSILGNDKSNQLDSFINQFICLILNYLDSNVSNIEKINKNPFNITFEFFKSVSYFNEVTNLYQPRLVIIGSNNKFTKSTSITNKDKKLLSVVVVGNDHQNKNKVTLPSKEIQDHFNNNISFSNDNSCFTYTSVVSLFNNLNEPPSLGLNIPINNNSNNNNDEDINNNINSNTNLPIPTVHYNQPRRKSMLDVLNNDSSTTTTTTTSTNTSSTKLSKSLTNNSDNTDNECAIDEGDDDTNTNTNIKILLPPTTKTVSRSSFGSIDNPNKPLIGHAKEKQDLFEKYNRRLSAVNVTPQVVKDQQHKRDNSNDKKSDSKRFFKWFKY